MTNKNLANLSGAYVLNALEAEEIIAFEAELDNSEQLRYEVIELQDTATLLAYAIDEVEPSEALKANIMDQIRFLPQLTAEPEKATTEVPAEPVKLATVTELKPRNRWFTRPIFALTTAAAVAALFVGAVVGGTITTPPTVDNQGNQLANITQASDVQRYSTAITTGGNATVVWSDAQKQAAIVTTGLGALTDNKIYELWYIDKNGKARAAGTLKPSGASNSFSVLTGTMHTGDSVGVTVEPQTGSTQPTTDPIVQVQTT